MNMKLRIKSFIAGICISIGCIVNLSCDNKYIGAILFAVGLYSICVCDFNLFTGKVCYLDNITDLIRIWIWNYIGCIAIALICIPTKLFNLSEKASTMCLNKLSETPLEIFILGVLCNILIYFAVEGYKNKQPILLIFSVAVFILCGFEHCVANMFYFSLATLSHLNIKNIILQIIFIFVNTLGNTTGGICMKHMSRLINE